ncbi:MAG TPA: SDR family oxidoreductase [Trueperaceae bacterium]
MRVLVTGTDGYLGTLVAPYLIERGHEVVGVDTGYYKEGWLYHGQPVSPRTVAKDLRRLVVDDLRGYDAIVHMAELSNDPTGELAPNITYDINHRGSVHLATLARQAGVPRFVYMSSCSVYGVAEQDVVDETSAVNPQTSYAECKVLVERDLTGMAGDDFSPTFLRNATAYGASPRMRFDIVLNNLAGFAHTTGEIRMLSDGTPWRPLVHGLDIAQAIACSLEAPREVVHAQVFNVGDTRHNYQVRQVAEIVADTFPGCKLTFGDSGSDNRSYRVNFDKIASSLPGFSCRWDARAGAEELRAVFERIDLTTELFESRLYTRLKMLKHLLRTGQIDESFYWLDARTKPDAAAAAGQPAMPAEALEAGA